jgi:hypothetical protein
MAEQLIYQVKRGKDIGLELKPHRYQDGFYWAHKTNSRNDPEGQKVKTIEELIDLVRSGYHVRMSNPVAGHAPSTVKPEIVF